MRNSMFSMYVCAVIAALSMTAGRFDTEEIEHVTPKIVAKCEQCKQGACVTACAVLKKGLEEKADSKQLCESMYPSLRDITRWNALNTTREQKLACGLDMRSLMQEYARLWSAHCLTACKGNIKAWDFSDKNSRWGMKGVGITSLGFELSASTMRDMAFREVVKRLLDTRATCAGLQEEVANRETLIKARDAAAAELATAQLKVAAIWRENAGVVRAALGCKTCALERLHLIYLAAQEICEWEPRRKAMAEEVRSRKQQYQKHGVAYNRELMQWIGELDEAELHIKEAMSTVKKREVAGLNCTKLGLLNIDDGTKKLEYYQMHLLNATAALHNSDSKIARLMEQ